jgi:acyl-CoA synthetase (NDP forming)
MSAALAETRAEGGSRLSALDALDAAFDARSIAVVGASTDPRKLGHMVLKMILASGFDGAIHPINPGAAEVLGVKAWPSLGAVPGPIDTAVVIVPAEHLADTLRQCAAAGVKLVAAITSGFAEAGEEGRELQQALLEALEDAPFRLVGPNCEGFVRPASRCFVTFSLMTQDLKPGPVGIIGQSGAVSGTISYRLNEMGVGISALVSTGNEVDLKAADILDWFARDEETRAVVAYLEEIRDAARFVETARAMRGRKAIVVQKPGRGVAARAAVSTHTGAIAGDDRVADGVFEELGIVRVPDLTAAVDAAAALSRGRTMKGLRASVVSIAGGLAVEAADLLEAAGFELPALSDDLQARVRRSLPYFAAVRNPIDLTGAVLSSPEAFGSVLDEVVSSDEIDAVIVIVTFAQRAEFADVLMQAANGSDKPVLIVWTAPATMSPEPLARFAEARFPIFNSAARAVTGLKAVARFSGLM